MISSREHFLFSKFHLNEISYAIFISYEVSFFLFSMLANYIYKFP